MKEADHKHQASARDYHDKDIRMRPIVVFVVVTSLFIGISFLGVTLFHRMLGRDAAGPAPDNRFTQSGVLPPEPRLQVVEKRTLQEQQAIERERLHGYGWVDRQAGVVHIPIEKAIELTAQRAQAAGDAQSK